jgi:hypothetical protein
VHDVYVDGKRKRKWTPAGRTEKEAEDKLIEIMGAVKRGTYVNPTRTTVADYLTETWLPSVRATIHLQRISSIRLSSTRTSSRMSLAARVSKT